MNNAVELIEDMKAAIHELDNSKLINDSSQIHTKQNKPKKYGFTH